ncbi:MAG: TIGR00730 family Rossman fold protein [Halocynthiibacter sp.]
MALSKSVCVFCGARNGSKPAYKQSGIETGKMLAVKGWRLVYGAGDIGIMGAVANAAQENGGATFGVIPEHLMNMEVGKRDLSQFIVTENMHERKKVMFMNSDAIVVLPGGAGSLDEFFEVLTWRQIGLHEKPIYLMNIDGYWDPLIALIDHVVAEEFAGNENKDYFQVVDTVPDLQSALDSAFS